MRKTDKYFRTELRKGFDEGAAVIADVLKKHFVGKCHTRVNIESDFNWDHYIDGFILEPDGKVYVNVYWQDDSTDGYNIIPLDDFKYKSEIIIPGKYFFAEQKIRHTHSGIRVEKSEIISAFKKAADYLEPAAIKARKAKNN